MTSEEPELRKKHHRSSEDADVVEEGGSKRRKHHRHHHHRRHRHRSSKHDSEIKEEEQDNEIPAKIVSNSQPDDDKEEGEILEEEEEEDRAFTNGELKKRDESDVESGEIKSAEELEHRNLRVHEAGDISSDRSVENGVIKDAMFKSPANKKYKSSFDKDSDRHFDPSDKDYETAETDMIKSREVKGERKHRDRTSRRDSGDVDYKSRRRSHRGLESSREDTEVDSSHRDCATRGRSRSPDNENDFDLRKHQNVDDTDAKDGDLARHSSRKPMNIDGDEGGNQRKSVSPEGFKDVNATVGHSSYYDQYDGDGHDKKRSRSRDSVRERRSRSREFLRERRSRSRSYFQDDRVSHRDLEVKISDRDGSGRTKRSGSRDNARNESDVQKLVRRDREDRHGSRDWVRDRERERERSSSYSRNVRREDRHVLRDTWGNDRERYTRERDRERERGTREKDREREGERDSHMKDRERDTNRVLDRDRDRDIDKDRHRDRGRDRNREREREDIYLDRYKDSRHSQHSEPGYHHERRSKHKVMELNHKDEAFQKGEGNFNRDDVKPEDSEELVELKSVVEEEEDIEKIKEESRKRREAILEKYRRQQQEKQEEKDSPVANKPTLQASPAKDLVNSSAEGFVSGNNGLGAYIAEPTFAVGKSPLENGSASFERARGTGGLGDGTPQSERSEDMFCDDIFGESPAGVRKMGKGEELRVERSGLNDNWDDAEGYYCYRFGEVLDGRYEVIAAHGKGVFSTVVRAKDLKAGKGGHEEVAIKIIRNNDTMLKAGMEELVVLKTLAGADPEDRRHCVRFISSFKYRNHLCLVFESLHMNLREVLKKFGRNIGLKLTAVRAYAKQLFIALKHLRNCHVLHCDIKPDNMLVNESKTVLKLCDFGNAMFAGKNEITPYLVSRFYRAPEIILGLSYDHPMDIWSVGCCLYELYSGKVLFPGPSNNDMLRLHMELKGSFPKKMLRKGAFTDQHFDHDMNFCATEEDPVSKKAVKRLLHNIKPKDISVIISGSPGEDPKMLANFKDLLEKIFVLDPEKRMTVSQALSHPFITGK